jgi:universal stress protein A
MLKQGKILVPLDFETPSDRTVGCAAAMANRLAWSVTLAHVFDSRGYALASGYVAYTPREVRALAADRRQRLDRIRHDLASLGVPNVETRLLEGLPAPMILDLANEGGFDLIVMATHGKPALWQRLIGLVAEDVLSEAPCPVLMVNDERPIATGVERASLGRHEARYAH